MKFFSTEIKTIEDLKKAYRKLALKYHPDRGGSNEEMADLNNEYEALFKQIQKQARVDNTNKQDMNADINDGFREVINKIIHCEGLDIEICGIFIWVGGDTYKYKDILRSAGFKWASQKKLWYWHVEGYKKCSKKVLEMSEIRGYYGSQKVATQDDMLRIGG